MPMTYDSRIFLRDTPEQILHTCSRMLSNPGHAEHCKVFTFHRFFSNVETADRLAQECSLTGKACLDHKNKLAEAIAIRMGPVRHKIEHHLLESGFTDPK